jgi:hypothetical protein
LKWMTRYGSSWRYCSWTTRTEILTKCYNNIQTIFINQW